MTETKKIKVYCGFISTGERWDVQNYAVRELERKYADKIELVYPEVFVSRIFHDYARNAAVEAFLKSDCDVLWFLDSDVSPNPKVFDLLTEHYDKWNLAGAPYPVFITPAGYDCPQVVFTVYRKGQHGFYASEIPQSGVDFVDGIATGCIFIKREVLETMEKPHFEFKYDTETRELKEGEDLGFCAKVNAKGLQFFIDYSLVCKHLKKVCLLDVNNYAISYANNAVTAFDRAIRTNVAERKLGLSQPKSKLILP